MRKLGRHVETGIAPRNERGEENEGAKFYWCGAPVSSTLWSFQDPTHVFLALRQGTSIEPCRKCLKALYDVLKLELGNVCD